MECKFRFSKIPYSAQANGRANAFTLVELLVVIAIIALLLAVLMPSLNRARAQAQSLVCKAHLKGAGTALHVYTTSWDDWLPGPNTSGAYLAAGGKPADISASTTAVQTTDWVSPILGDSLGLPKGREDRFIKICNTAFKCPSNRKKYDFEYNGPVVTKVPITSVSVVSYSASLAFHVYRMDKNPSGGPITDYDMSFQATVPQSYIPKFAKVGKPSDKVFAMDGTRYVELAAGTKNYVVSINGDSYQKQGGNYMAYGPTTQFDGDPFKLSDRKNPKLVDAATPFAYRHNKKMNVVFFDGHCESLDLAQSLNTSLYWPRGSRINNARSTYDTHATNGQIIK